MVSLAATIARRRIYYPRPIATLPDILMIDIPRRYAGKGLPLGRFYPIMVESVEEESEVEALLAAKRDSPVPLGFLGQRPSTFAREHLTIAHYGPSRPGWPFVQLCQWPAEFAAKTSSKDQLFARGVYTFEMFASREQLESASKVLLASLDRRHARHVEMIFPDWSADPDAPPN